MSWMRIFALLALFTAIAAAQDEVDEGGDEGGDDESVIEIGAGPGDADAEYKAIRVEPFPPPVAREPEEPNRPEPAVVGQWQPPALAEADAATLEDLLKARTEKPDDLERRTRLANFYLRVGWLPKAEAEFLECAKLDPESIRPWEGLLEVYAAKIPGRSEELELPNGLVIPANMPAAQRRQLRELFRREVAQPDWIASPRERSERVARALSEIVRRRPDDIARRRKLLEHYAGEGRYEKVAEQAREILERVPGDVATRYQLVQATIYGAEDPHAPEVLSALRAMLEDNVQRAPEHVASMLRLVRVLAVQEGAKQAERITELQRRAFLRLFVVPALGDVPYREDTFRMAQNLAGKDVANRLWDDVMQPSDYNPWGEDTRHFVRWIEPFRFPHAEGDERDRVIRTLARRGDQAAAVVILSYLWHAVDPEAYTAELGPVRTRLEKSDALALGAVGGLGEVAFPAAEKFLRAADTPVRRRRGVRALALIGDVRAVPVLIDQLAVDVEKDRSYGVADALEALGDARAIDALAAAAADTERPLPRRREAAEALAAFKDPRAVETINLLSQQADFETVGAYGRFRLTGSEDALAKLVKFAEIDGGSEEMLRLARKCPDDRIKRVHIAILRHSRDPVLRERTLRVIRERYWDDSRAEVEKIFLEEAKSAAVSPFVLAELGEIGGAESATCLLGILEKPGIDDTLWAAACRALARTGDERAVQWFSRRKVLEKDPGKRKLAVQLHAEAAKRHAELLRQQ